MKPIVLSAPDLASFVTPDGRRGPAFNHTREDSPLTPCAECARAMVEVLVRAVWTERVRTVAGQFGNRLDLAKAALHYRALEAGLRVLSLEQSAAIRLKDSRGRPLSEVVETIENEDGSKTENLAPVCEITLTAKVGPPPLERWVRMTHGSGPSAVMVLETEGGAIKSVRVLHEMDSRDIAMAKAFDALTEGQ